MKRAAGALTSGRRIRITIASEVTPSLLTECFLDLRDADVDPFQYIGVHGLRRAPKTQCIQFLLQNYVKFAQRDKLVAGRFCDSNTVQEILGTLPVVCQAPWPRVF